MPITCTPPEGFVFKQHETPKVKPPVDYVSRFWRHVEKTETCWNWIGATSTNHNGRDEWTKYKYGVFALDGNPYSRLAHRCVLSIVFGTELPDDWDVVPVCENRLCVNPDHLALRIDGVLYAAIEVLK